MNISTKTDTPPPCPRMREVCSEIQDSTIQAEQSAGLGVNPERNLCTSRQVPPPAPHRTTQVEDGTTEARAGEVCRETSFPAVSATLGADRSSLSPQSPHLWRQLTFCVTTGLTS